MLPAAANFLRLTASPRPVLAALTTHHRRNILTGQESLEQDDPEINNIIKDEKDYKDVVQLLKDNMAFLKDVYLDL